MSQLAVLLQESAERESGDSRGTAALTILRLLREEMDGLDLGMRRKRSFKERIGFNKMGCCGGPIWGFGPTTMPVLEVDDGEQELVEGDAQEIHHQLPSQEEEEELPPTDQSRSQPNGNIMVCGSENRSDSSAGMNLAAALAAERQYRSLQEPEVEILNVVGRVIVEPVPVTPARVSLMRLLEESDGGDEKLGCDSMCCVCMVRKKGAAFIPCGHTYCRVCSRELWLNRGSCPLCNRAILEILDIF